MGRRAWYAVARDFWSHTDWRGRSPEERLAWLYLLSLVRWSAGDGIARGQARTSAAEIGREVGRSRGRAHDWLRRWVELGAITYEVERDDANRPTGIVVTVLAYDRWAAQPDAEDVATIGVSGEVADAKQPRLHRPDAKPDAEADAKPDAEDVATIGVSGEVADAKPDAEADAKPDASCLIHGLRHENLHGGGTHALARGTTTTESNQTPGSHDADAIDQTRQASSTPHASAATETIGVAADGAAVDRDPHECPDTLTLDAVRDLWAAVWRSRYGDGDPPGIGGRRCHARQVHNRMIADAQSGELPEVWERWWWAMERFIADARPNLLKAVHPLPWLLGDLSRYDRDGAAFRLIASAPTPEPAPVDVVIDVDPEPTTYRRDPERHAPMRRRDPEPRTYFRATGPDADRVRGVLVELFAAGMRELDGATLCRDGERLVLVHATRDAVLPMMMRLVDPAVIEATSRLVCVHGFAQRNLDTAAETRTVVDELRRGAAE